MADTKITELPTSTTPAKTSTVPAVVSTTTSQVALSTIVRSTLGWFEVTDAASTQTGIDDDTITKVQVDGSTTGVGGYDHLPHGILSASVYDSANDKVLLGWLTEGQSLMVQLHGDITTGTAITSATFTFKFFSSGDVEQTALTRDFTVPYPVVGDYPFQVQTIVPITATLASDGYCTVHVTFNGGSGADDSVIDMQSGSLMVSTLS